MSRAAWGRLRQSLIRKPQVRTVRAGGTIPVESQALSHPPPLQEGAQQPNLPQKTRGRSVQGGCSPWRRRCSVLTAHSEWFWGARRRQPWEFSILPEALQECAPLAPRDHWQLHLFSTSQHGPEVEALTRWTPPHLRSLLWAAGGQG